MKDSSTILIVDDEPIGRETLEGLLFGQGYELAFAGNGLEAMTLAQELRPDLILLDLILPGMDGFEVCRHLRADSCLAEVPVVIITALDDQATRLRGLEAGVDDFMSKPINGVELRARIKTITRLNRYRQLFLERMRRSEVEEQLRQASTDLVLAYDATLAGWSRALDLRDQETEGHSRRVTEMTLCLARAMGLTELELTHLRRGALLHDIGKLGIPDQILLKPGPLTEEEWVIMRRHPIYAYELLAEITYLRPALDIPYCHHEKWDGTGYPRGLRGEQIPLAARIFAVVDVWDALRSNRPYRSAWPDEQVRTYLHSQAGKHFDPQVVELFLTLDWPSL